MATRKVLQFRVELCGIEPPIWRRLQVPSTFSFWELHVAIQDAMGWLDYHQHAFHLADPHTGSRVEIGIPDPDGFDQRGSCLPGWNAPVSTYFVAPGTSAVYVYDFGDGWEHAVVLEAILDRIPRQRYPVCLAGERACPPEDCGGVSGYDELLRTIRDPFHDEHAHMLEWLGGRFDPEAFSAGEVKFDSPRKRWNVAFGGS